MVWVKQISRNSSREQRDEKMEQWGVLSLVPFLSLSLSRRVQISLHTKKNLAKIIGNLQEKGLQKMEGIHMAESFISKVWRDGENFDRFLWFSTLADYWNQLDHLDWLVNMVWFPPFLGDSNMHPRLKKHCDRRLFQLVGMPWAKTQRQRTELIWGPESSSFGGASAEVLHWGEENNTSLHKQSGPMTKPWEIS